MLSRRKSTDDGSGASVTGKAKMQNALLKLSTANAFARGNNAASFTGRSVEASVASRSSDAPYGGHGSSGSMSYPDDLGAVLNSMPAAIPQPRSLYYGMYAEYEDVMDLIHTGTIADGGTRRLLSHVSYDQVVHVAHLGIGACCTVDLVAVHCADGSRLVAAAKSCYLPPSDPRMRASLREAELLRRCADCPFIMQLLAVLQDNNMDRSHTLLAASPRSPRSSFHLASAHSGEAAYGASPGPRMSNASSPSGTMMSSPGFQAWSQWRGGGGGEDLERQIMQRLAAANGGGSGSGFYGPGMGMGSMRMDGLSAENRFAGSSTGGWESGTCGTQEESFTGLVAPAHAHGYGGGWMHGGRGGGGCASDGRGSRRRASLDIIDMYGGCTGMGTDSGGGGGAGTSGAPAAAAAPGGGGDSPLMYTLLVGWARCGDLRRLVQHQLARSSAHQNHKHTGAGPPVAGMHPLLPEDSVRFYTGCLALALEHLHTRLNTVHRDLKLANLLLLSSGYAIVGDLGTAVDLTTVQGGRLNSRVGSPGHMAPECRDRDEAGYDTSADMWSVGACIFSLLTGHLPAGVAGPPNRAWSPPLSRHWSGELQDLLGRLLAWSPRERPNVAQLMRDPWFRGFSWTSLRAQKMTPPSNTPWRELLWWPKESRQLL